MKKEAKKPQVGEIWIWMQNLNELNEKYLLLEKTFENQEKYNFEGYYLNPYKMYFGKRIIRLCIYKEETKVRGSWKLFAPNK